MRELIKRVLNEHVGDLSENFRSTDTFPAFIRQQLEKIYKPIGMWGKAPNPNDDCITGTGVINIFPHSDEDVWSILNRFDTNTKVKNKLNQLFLETNPPSNGDQDFRKWIDENSNDLFGPNGTYVEELVELNMGTITSGTKNEMMAVNVLKQKFPNNEIKRYCSGDIRDTRKGIDIVIVMPGKDITVQVKPFIKIDSYVEPDGDTFFEVKSYFESNRYSERNVFIFMFVNFESEEFILFKNNKTKIGQMRNNITRFYEPPLYSNMVFVNKEKRRSKALAPADELFNVDNETLKNLEYRKAQIERLINNYKKKLKLNN
jgi:hypothetical protein